MTNRSFLLPAALILVGLLPAQMALAADCPAPPPPVRDLAPPRFYADKAGSRIDPQAAQRHKEAVAPLTAFLRQVVSDADKSLKRPSPKSRAEAAQCALTWIEAWAKGDAWLGTIASRQAEYQRKWDLAGVALAYLKVRPHATPAQRQAIEPWLIRFADAARGFFDDKARKRNNHWYWLGLAVGATALGTDSERHWQMARQIMRDAARDIRPDGTLPHEMERGQRTLYYHAFAAMPLVTLAELAAERGEDWYAVGDGALHRLAKTTLAGLSAPEAFDRLAGTPQERPVKPGAGWTQLYAARFPDRLAAAVVGSSPKHRWLGGDVLLLKAALAARGR